MSSTRKKLSRLFKAPTTQGAESFAPRDLNRTPREFDADGVPLSPACAQEDGLRPSPTPPPSKAGGMEFTHRPPSASSASSSSSAHPHAMHTAPWAAGAAFEGWKAQRKSTHARPSQKDAAPTARRPSTAPPASSSAASTPPRPDTSPPTSRHAKTSIPAATSAGVRRAKEVPQGHVHRMDGGGPNHRVGMRAAHAFAQWKAGKEPTPRPTTAQASSPHAATRDGSSSTDVRSTDARPVSGTLPTTSHDVPAAPHPLPTDRVRRRAIQSQTLGRPRNDGATQQTVPLAGGTSAADAEDLSTGAAPASSVPSKAPITATAHTPAERLMWISAHRAEISDAHAISTLRALEGSGLRGGHEARRLRMLAKALLRLERDEESLETLEALQRIVPHDAWTLLRLAETCAKRGDTLEAGLAWCEDLRRLHPWLSQAKEIEARIRQRLAQLN